MIIKLIDRTRKQFGDLFGIFRQIAQTDKRFCDRDTLQLEIRRARRLETCVSLIAIRPSGSVTIAKIASLVQEAKREFDLMSEDGMDLLLLLPNTDADQARQFAHRLQTAIDETFAVSPKIGVGTFPDDALTLQGILQQAQADLGDERIFTERPRDAHVAACGMYRVIPGTSSTVL